MWLNRYNVSCQHHYRWKNLERTEFHRFRGYKERRQIPSLKATVTVNRHF